MNIFFQKPEDEQASPKKKRGRKPKDPNPAKPVEPLNPTNPIEDVTIIDCPECQDRFFEVQHLEQHLDIKHRKPVNPQRQFDLRPELDKDDISILEIMDQEITGRSVQHLTKVETNTNKNNFLNSSQVKSATTVFVDSVETKPEKSIHSDPSSNITVDPTIIKMDVDPPIPPKRRGRPAKKNIVSSTLPEVIKPESQNPEIRNPEITKPDYVLKKCSVVLQRINLDKDTVYELKRTEKSISGQDKFISGQDKSISRLTNNVGKAVDKEKPEKSLQITPVPTTRTNSISSKNQVQNSRSEIQETNLPNTSQLLQTKGTNSSLNRSETHGKNLPNTSRPIETNTQLFKQEVGSPKRPSSTPANSILLTPPKSKSPKKAFVPDSACKRSTVRLVPLARLLKDNNSITNEPNINVNALDSEIILSPIKLFQSFVHPGSSIKEANSNQNILQKNVNNKNLNNKNNTNNNKNDKDKNNQSVAKRLRLDSITREASVNVTPLRPGQIQALASKQANVSLNLVYTSINPDNTSTKPVIVSTKPVLSGRKTYNSMATKVTCNTNTKPINSFFKPISKQDATDLASSSKPDHSSSKSDQTGSKQVNSSSKSVSRGPKQVNSSSKSEKSDPQLVQSTSKPDQPGSRQVSSSPEPEKTKVHSDFRTLLTSLSQKVREVETGIKCGACSERFRDYDQLILHIQNSHNSQNSQHQSPAAANSKKSSRNNKTKKAGGPQNLGKGAASKPARKNARKLTRNSNNKMVGDPQSLGNSTVSKSPSKEGGLQKKYLCLVCDKTFYTRALLERHTFQKHKIEGTDPRNPGNGTVPKNVADIKCSICSKEFASNIQLSVHYNATHKRK